MIPKPSECIWTETKHIFPSFIHLKSLICHTYSNFSKRLTEWLNKFEWERRCEYTSTYTYNKLENTDVMIEKKVIVWT